MELHILNYTCVIDDVVTHVLHMCNGWHFDMSGYIL